MRPYHCPLYRGECSAQRALIAPFSTSCGVRNLAPLIMNERAGSGHLGSCLGGCQLASWRLLWAKNRLLGQEILQQYRIYPQESDMRGHTLDGRCWGALSVDCTLVIRSS